MNPRHARLIGLVWDKHSFFVVVNCTLPIQSCLEQGCDWAVHRLQSCQISHLVQCAHIVMGIHIDVQQLCHSRTSAPHNSATLSLFNSWTTACKSAFPPCSVHARSLPKNYGLESLSQDAKVGLLEAVFHRQTGFHIFVLSYSASCIR